MLLEITSERQAIEWTAIEWLLAVIDHSGAGFMGLLPNARKPVSLSRYSPPLEQGWTQPQEKIAEGILKSGADRVVRHISAHPVCAILTLDAQTPLLWRSGDYEPATISSLRQHAEKSRAYVQFVHRFQRPSQHFHFLAPGFWFA
jgi:hypothetical protein